MSWQLAMLDWSSFGAIQGCRTAVRPIFTTGIRCVALPARIGHGGKRPLVRSRGGYTIWKVDRFQISSSFHQ